MSESQTLTVKLVRSPIGSNERQRATLRALGLTRVGKTATVPDNGPSRGRIGKVAHLVEVSE